MKVEEVMSRGLKTIEPSDTIKSAARKMLKYDISGLVVTSAYIVKGILTERDIIKAFVNGKSPDMPVSAIMRKKVRTIYYDEDLEEAAKKMLKYKIKRLPVIKGGKCVGIVTATDLLKYEEKLADNLALFFMLEKRNIQGS